MERLWRRKIVPGRLRHESSALPEWKEGEGEKKSELSSRGRETKRPLFEKISSEAMRVGGSIFNM
jgi:hypothetical protein